MELADWIRGRERAALGRVRLAGVCLAMALCVVAGWLGWREARLAALPVATREAVVAETVMLTRLRLKNLTLVAYLAKVQRNSLLPDIIGRYDSESTCIQAGDLAGLPDSSPCAAQWMEALEKFWNAAFGQNGPPIPKDLMRDPWGAPYLLNLSESSCGLYGNWCPPDTIRSAGPDGKPNTPDDLNEAVPQHLGPSRIK